MPRPRLVAAALAATLLTAACGSSQVAPDAAAPTPDGPAATATPPDPTAARPHASEDLVGTLVHEPLPATKSLEAYLGEELFLVIDGDPTRRVLRPSDAVSRDALLALAGQRVRVSVAWTDGHLPDPGSSYPMGAGGEPLRQGAGWQVLTLAPAAP